MKRTKVIKDATRGEVFTLVEMTAKETELEFGYDFSKEVPGAVKELVIEESEGSLVAYEMEDGTVQLYVSGRGKGYHGTLPREMAIETLIEDAII